MPLVLIQQFIGLRKKSEQDLEKSLPLRRNLRLEAEGRRGLSSRNQPTSRKARRRACLLRTQRPVEIRKTFIHSVVDI